MENAETRPEHDAPERRARTVLFLAAAAIYLGLAWRFDFLCDDAYISFRYAAHLAEGAGLVFNPGESPPVEGYSNFLWVVWLGIWELLGVSAPIASRVTSFLCGGLLLASVVRYGERRLHLRPASAGALAVSFASFPTVTLWATSGLETMPFALFTFWTFARLSSSAWQAGACALAAALLRADGAAWAALMICAAVSIDRTRMRDALIAAGILVAGVAAHVLWRHGYYGEWMPNTARVKAGLSGMRLERGAKYVAAFLLAVPTCALAPIAAAVLADRSLRRMVVGLWFVILATAAYAIFVGGDFMPMGRFLVVAMPFIAIAFALTFDRLLRDRGLSPAVAFASALTALSILPSFDVHVVPRAIRERAHFRWNEEAVRSEFTMWQGMRERAEQWRVLGRALALHTHAGESLIAGNIGAIGYESRLWLFDVFGLVSPEVARREAPLRRASPGHDKAVTPEFFLDRRPTFLSAFLSRPDIAATAGLPPEWQRELAAGRIRLERIPLEAARGIPAGLELRLLRFDWSR